jgi:predicted Rossmann fold nucleotide-binding protein DprA/Smf involved in DNA uptake
MQTKELTHDAKAILLLCGHFGKSDATSPLSLKEYNRLADWMQERRLRPADLLNADSLEMLQETPREIKPEHINSLLSRGAVMALVIEKWLNTGIWIICRSDTQYPERLKQHLKKHAPPILYGIGDFGLLDRGGLAVVGSRNVDASGQMFTRQVAERFARERNQIVSGGARGVDQIAMLEALDAGGSVVGVLADSLLKASVSKSYRDAIRQKRLTLISPYSPDAGFNVGNAMNRNKLIYALADYALIISAESGKGGTWAGAIEELRRETARPVFVRSENKVPKGNLALIGKGALPFPEHAHADDLKSQVKSANPKKELNLAKQLSIFGEEPVEQYAESVKDATDSYQATASENAAAEASAKDTKQETAGSIYEAVLPVMLNALKDWSMPKDLAESLDVHKIQLDAWLKRAVSEGKIVKKSRPTRYRRHEKYPVG